MLFFHQHFNGYVAHEDYELIAFRVSLLKIPWPIFPCMNDADGNVILSPMSMPDVDEIM
jgi:hypothetical protein